MHEVGEGLGLKSRQQAKGENRLPATTVRRIGKLSADPEIWLEGYGLSLWSSVNFSDQFSPSGFMKW